MRHFFVIGAMKSGTTSLYDHLRTHPEIYASSIKEPSFFTQEAPTHEKVSEYKDLYSATTKEEWALEGSTNYSKYPSFQGVPERIHSMFPDAKLIYILRHPVERIYSHYIHNLSVGREHRPFEKAVRAQDQHYLNVSRYYLQLSQYLAVFSAENILVFTFEEFLQRKVATLQRIFSFLGLNSSFIPPNLHRKRNISADKTVDHPVIRAVSSLVYLPPSIRYLLGRRFRRPTPDKKFFFNPALHERIIELLSEDTEQLKHFLGDTTRYWDLHSTSFQSSFSRTR